MGREYIYNIERDFNISEMIGNIFTIEHQLINVKGMTEKIILQTLYYSNNGFEQKSFNNDKTTRQIFWGTGYLQRFKVCPLY